MEKLSVCISIVTYHSDLDMLKKTVDSIVTSFGPGIDVEMRLVINDQLGEVYYRGIFPDNISVIILCGHGNVGFGHAHNLALLSSNADYYLVANPDIALTQGAIHSAIEVMKRDPDVALLSPQVVDGKNNLQYLCKKYPSVLLLFIRGFFPRILKEAFKKYIRHFEFSDKVDRNERFEPAIATGCFMLLRSDVFRKVGGFDPQFFLYFEDYDLSLRIADHAKVIYDPSVKIIHHGGGASRKGLWHIRLFVVSAYKFFNKHGWRWC